MSRISDHISVSDSYTVLMDDCLKENQSLREQLRQHDEENALVKVRRAFKKSGIFVKTCRREQLGQQGNGIKER